MNLMLQLFDDCLYDEILFLRKAMLVLFFREKLARGFTVWDSAAGWGFKVGCTVAKELMFVLIVLWRAPFVGWVSMLALAAPR